MPTPMSAVNNIPQSGLPPFALFDPHSDRASLAVRWKKWSRRFENLLISLREFNPVIRHICEFTDVDCEIRTQMIYTKSDSRLRQKALREQLDLKAFSRMVRCWKRRT